MKDYNFTLEHTLIPTVYIHVSDGEIDIDFIRLCRNVLKNGQNLSFDKRYLTEKHKPYHGDTFFGEIKNFGAVPENKMNLFEKRGSYGFAIEEIVSEAKRIIKEYFVTMWDSTTPKLFFHSSGWDSRILSGCLCELRNELGWDWIGDIHFRCHQADESESFLKIMELQGWHKGQYSAFAEKNEDCYDLGRFDRPVFGFVDMTQQYNFVPEFDTKKMILISGIMGGEQLDYPKRYSQGFKNNSYCQNVSLNRLLNFIPAGSEGEMITYWMSRFQYAMYPYLSYDYLSFYSKISLEMILKYDIRHEIVKSFKDTLGIDLMNVQYYGHNYNWKFSEKRKKEISENWLNSKFFAEFYKDLPMINPIQNFNKFDGKLWMLAAAWEAIYS